MSIIRIDTYQSQTNLWPSSGRHILAQFDESSVVVYQAFCPEIADEAVREGHFGDAFSLTRMSWIKTNFLWMMFRCGWATKHNQERVLAVTLPRDGLERLLTQAVPSSFSPEQYATQQAWHAAVTRSDVRLQWDPDHSPSGGKVARRAIQLGLRGEALHWYAREGIVRIEDITEFVREQHQHVQEHRLDRLQTPTENCYPLSESIRQTLGMNHADAP